MKLQNLLVLATFAVAGNAAELSIGNAIISATANQPATLNVTLASQGASLSGMQFDLIYDASFLNITVIAGPAAEAAGKNVQSAVLEGGHQRVLIVGMNQTTVADGVVAVLQVSLKGQAAGKTFPIRLTAQAGADAQAKAIAVSAAHGSVKVEVNGNPK